MTVCLTQQHTCIKVMLSKLVKPNSDGDPLVAIAGSPAEMWIDNPDQVRNVSSKSSTVTLYLAQRSSMPPTRWLSRGNTTLSGYLVIASFSTKRTSWPLCGLFQRVQSQDRLNEAYTHVDGSVVPFTLCRAELGELSSRQDDIRLSF